MQKQGRLETPEMGGSISLLREREQKSQKEMVGWQEERKDDQETQEISCRIFNNKAVYIFVYCKKKLQST